MAFSGGGGPGSGTGIVQEYIQGPPAFLKS